MESPAKTIIDICTIDFNQVKTLWDKFRSLSIYHEQQREETAYELIRCCSELFSLEEMVLYPLIVSKCPNGKEVSTRLLDQHQKFKNQLYEINNMKIADPNFVDKLNICIPGIQAFVQMEEQQTLPLLVQNCTHDELINAGKTWHSRKSIAPSRPHPGAPNTPPANLVANATLAPIDSLKDKSRFKEVDHSAQIVGSKEYNKAHQLQSGIAAEKSYSSGACSSSTCGTTNAPCSSSTCGTSKAGTCQAGTCDQSAMKPSLGEQLGKALGTGPTGFGPSQDLGGTQFSNAGSTIPPASGGFTKGSSTLAKEKCPDGCVCTDCTTGQKFVVGQQGQAPIRGV